jgi:hypothetical protein
VSRASSSSPESPRAASARKSGPSA